MEEVYDKNRFRVLYSKKIDVDAFFSHYTKEILQCYVKKLKGENMRALLDMEEEEYSTLKTSMDPKRALSTSIPKSFVPKRRFLESWALYDLPTEDVPLVTITNLKSENREDKYRRIRNAKYYGQVVLEVEKEPEDSKRCRNLDPHHDYAVCVRVYSMVPGPLSSEKKYTPSQELWVPGKMTLERIKDRIICHVDFEHTDPVVKKPDQSCSQRKIDVNKYGMFYINDNFYVDKRHGNDPKHDYSVGVIEWMKSRGLKPGIVKDMQSVPINSFPIRLGYPYLYMHQGNCEHLITFTDARLLKAKDLLFIEDYPVLKSFASLRGKYCILCLARHAKLCVTDCDILPYDVAFICNLCAYSFLFDSEGVKKASFNLYRYVDRTAII